MAQLCEICDLVNTKVKINEEIYKDLMDSYISTENMLPNKGGVIFPAKPPKTGSVTAYECHDILVSNIRPYFKKIWYANKNGTCSNDVLVFRAKEGVLPDYLYYILSSDSFFEYSMKTSKGTKMPRGDKASIMKYVISCLDYNTQKKATIILKLIDKKIELNNKINKNLAQQAQAIFNDIFPNISNGSAYIGDYITPKRGKGLLSKDAIRGNIPVIAGGLEPSTYHNVPNTQPPVLAISASGANAGYVSLWNIPIWSSDSSYIDSTMTDDVYFWYTLLKARQEEIFDAQTGSAQPHIYPKHIAAMPIAKLKKDDISKFTKFVTPLFITIGQNKEQNSRLATLRDTLLPHLLTGKINVSDIDG